MIADISNPFNVVATTIPVRLPKYPYLPRPPYERWDLLNILAPIFVSAQTSTMPVPTIAHILLQATVHGRIVWNAIDDISLLSVGGNAGGGIDVIQTDFVNPADITDSDCIEFFYNVSFDAAVQPFTLGLGFQVVDYNVFQVQPSPGQIAVEVVPAITPDVHTMTPRR